MKFLKIRYIILYVLVIAIGLFLGLYFIGGLTAKSLEINRIEFDQTKFADLDTEALSKEYIVAQNDKYTMFIDETTTVVKIAVNSSCKNINDSSTCEAVYETAKTTSDYGDEKSNLIVRYFDENGKPNTTGFNSYEYSVAYFDRLKGVTTPHYKLNYIENGIDILYEIGNFTNIKSFFPSNFDRTAYDELFRGNLQFYTKNSAKLTEIEGIKTDAYTLQYTGFGATYSAECAAYLETNGLATVTEAKDTYGNSLGRWDLKNIPVTESGALGLKVGVDYNSSTSPCTSNPFTNSAVISSLYSPQSYSLSQTGADPNVTLITDTTQYVTNSSYTLKFNYNISTTLYKKLYSYMYDVTKVANSLVADPTTGVQKYSPTGNYLVNSNKPVYYDYNGDGVITSDELFQVGGYQAKDEEGNYLFDEDGKPVQVGFTQEEAEEQNEIFGNTSDAASAAFQVCLRFELTEDGLKVSVINDSIIEGREAQYSGDIFAHNFKIYEIQVVPYLTSNQDPNSKGQIVLPDGSGAVISFNSVKDAQNAKTYTKNIYGMDYTTPQETKVFNTKDLMFGMYGFLDQTGKKGTVAIVEEGAAQTSIQADFMRAAQTTTFNYARFTTSYRVKESVSVSTGSSFTKWSIDLYQYDVVYSYRFLDNDELDYVNVAKKYREYLIEKYNLDENGDKTKNHVVSIEFLGAFEKKKLTLGIVHNADYSLTTFKQALDIVNELNLAGVKDFNVSYEAWTNDAMEAKADNSIKAARVLGGKSDLIELSNYLKANAFDFYPIINVASNWGWDYPYGNLKYSPKSVGSTYSVVNTFVAATGLADTRHGSMVSPRFYTSYIENIANSYNKFGIGGVQLVDLGNNKIGDYAKKIQIYTETGALYQADAIATAAELMGKVMLYAPYDYAFKNVSNASGVPLTTTLYPSVDYSIPLYQLVVSGLFDYSGEIVNYENSYSPDWYFLKAIETGSNLSFAISAEDTKVLLETDYTNYYNTYYLNWKQKIISLNNKLNDLGIYQSRLVSHKYLADNVAEVEYENGLTIIINFDNTTYQDTASGLAVRSNWYMVVKEGK